MELAQRYEPKETEKRIREFWEKEKIYQFNPKSKKPLFSIDTPPPYASAEHLHVGHGMHYSQFEFIARYKRMQGFNVFFPMGYDDNGLPTERYVEKKYKIDKSRITRAEFIRLCLEESRKAGQTYYDLFTRLGFSIDWDLLYQTIGEKARRVAQKSFLDLYKKNRLERTDRPTTWCTTCQTAIAQADLENIEIKSCFSDILFKCRGKDLMVATTRPEMLPACVALFYHPEDRRYRDLKEKFAKVPLFDYEVPLMSDETVDKEKGTGLMMVCTFGDKEDIEKWHRYSLPLRVVLTEEGRMNELAGQYQGMKIKEAREKIINDLKKKGALIDQKEILHAVNVHERCGTEIEFLKKPQWSIKVLDKKEELIEIAQKINWYPKHMRVRYEHWVKNLQWDWGISRQRYYGVPFPVWYCKGCGAVLLPLEKDLPVDPREEKFKGKCSCGSNKIEPEIDIMDTWMTSSLTPEINADWGGKKERKNFLPMSLRPQAHDIIRTWTFYTIVKAHYHHNCIPWKNIMISGHGQDPHGQKMSKSKGNFIIAEGVIDKYSADAFRFWAASVKLGDDLPFQEKELVAGQKFLTKLWNASKFCLGHLEGYKGEGKTTEVFDKWLLSKLNRLIKESTESFEQYEYSKTKLEVEKFFWHIFCDYYLEIVKGRLYNPEKKGKKGRESAQFTLHKTLLAILKLMAPIMPHITEELYQLGFRNKEKEKSLHLSSWPEFNSKEVDEKSEEIGDMGIEILNIVRKFKSEKKMALNEELKELILHSGKIKDFEKKINFIGEDLKSAAKAKEIKFNREVSLSCENLPIELGIKV